MLGYWWIKSDLGSRSLGTRMGKPLKNRRCLSRYRTIWACANLRDGVKIIDFPLVYSRHTERSRTHAAHWSRHRSPDPNTDEFSGGPNQEVRFFLGLGTRAVRPTPERPGASLGYNDEISRVCLCAANSGPTVLRRAWAFCPLSRPARCRESGVPGQLGRGYQAVV